MPEGIDFLPMVLKMNVLNSIFYKREMFQPKYHWVEIKYLGAIKANTFSQYRQKSQELEADRLYPLISIIKFEKLLKRFATIANLFDVNLRITHSCCYKFSFSFHYNLSNSCCHTAIAEANAIVYWEKLSAFMALRYWEGQWLLLICLKHLILMMVQCWVWWTTRFGFHMY